MGVEVCNRRYLSSRILLCINTGRISILRLGEVIVKSLRHLRTDNICVTHKQDLRALI